MDAPTWHKGTCGFMNRIVDCTCFWKHREYLAIHVDLGIHALACNLFKQEIDHCP